MTPPPPPRGRRPAPAPAFGFNGRRRRQRRRRRSARRLRVVLALVAVGALALVGAGAVGTFTGAASWSDSCDLGSLTPASIGANSFVYAAGGAYLGAIPAERNRQPVELGEMSPWLAKSTIAIEDRRFYEHGGIDAEGIARALVEDIKAGKVVQGGSTITQQLVRNLYISQERTLERKLKEACLAIKLNRARSKDWILAQYMNTVYYGNHAYGVEAAAQTYFSKKARNLSLVEAALLAGLPQAPSIYNPFQRPDAAAARRNEVLRALLDTGDISREQYEEAVATPLTLKAGQLYKRIREPFFFGYVRDQLIDEYGAETVRSGGLRVYTTIDPKYQAAARKAISETLNEPDDPSAALVAIDPANGEIKAMAAVTPGKSDNQFNLAADSRRQAGSTFKTFVLAAAIEQGINPWSTTYVSAPFRYSPLPDLSCEDERVWCVETYDKSYRGTIPISSATLSSDNSVYAQLTLDVGPEKVAEMARKLGVRSALEPFPSIGLGAADISPLDMSSAYATLAAGGVYSKPMAIRKVVLANGEEDGDAGWGKVERTRVIPEWVAHEVTRILEQNMTAGTGTLAYFGRTSAGKTGTTDDHADAWFCGYTPTLQASVWVGYPEKKVPMLNVHGIRVAGGTFPAQIWNRFMSVALEGTEPTSWKIPDEYPQWKPFTRGQYAIQWDQRTTEDTPETTEATATTTTQRPTTSAPPPSPPPTTTEEPPPPTEAPPPPTTTEAPPPPPTTTAEKP
jgi:penicillin-binding protein 1A